MKTKKDYKNELSMTQERKIVKMIVKIRQIRFRLAFF